MPTISTLYPSLSTELSTAIARAREALQGQTAEELQALLLALLGDRATVSAAANLLAKNGFSQTNLACPGLDGREGDHPIHNAIQRIKGCFS